MSLILATGTMVKMTKTNSRMSSVIDWRLEGFHAGKLGDPDNPLCLDRRIYLAALAMCCRLAATMPRGSYTQFATGYREGLVFAPLEAVRQRMKPLWSADRDQLEEFIGVQLDLGTPVEEIVARCDQIITRWLNE